MCYKMVIDIFVFKLSRLIMCCSEIASNAEKGSSNRYTSLCLKRHRAIAIFAIVLVRVLFPHSTPFGVGFVSGVVTHRSLLLPRHHQSLLKDGEDRWHFPNH